MKYFYSWGLLFILPFTIYAYIKSTKELRIKMIISGTGFGIMSVIFDYLYTDYWLPNYLFNNFRFEDFLYGFLFGGMMTAVHNILRKKKMQGKLNMNYLLSLIYIVILLVVFYLIVNVLHLNYIYALSLTPLIIGIISFIIVKGDIKDIIITIISSMLITVFYYTMILLIYPNMVQNHFILNNISGLLLLGIPIEEHLFAFCLAVGCTYTYEAVFRLKV